MSDHELRHAMTDAEKGSPDILVVDDDVVVIQAMASHLKTIGRLRFALPLTGMLLVWAWLGLLVAVAIGYQ